MARAEDAVAPQVEGAQNGTSDPEESGIAAAEGRDTQREQIQRAAAAKPQHMPADAQQSTFDWFMEGYDEQGSVEPRYPFEINVSTDPNEDKKMTWWLKPIDSTRIDELRKLCELPTNREQRRRGDIQIDNARFNAFLVFEATVDPDLREAAQRKNEMDGSKLVRWRFRFKPLLVDQIAGHVLLISGGDDEDMQRKEITAGKTS